MAPEARLGKHDARKIDIIYIITLASDKFACY